MTIVNNDLITPHQALEDLKIAQVKHAPNEITMVVSKRDIEEHVRTTIDERWATFDQMRMVTFKVLDSDTINTYLTSIRKSKDLFTPNKKELAS